MSQPPDYLPEDPGWRGKPKDDYYEPDRSRRGCTAVVILALVFGIFLLIVGGAALYIYDPSIIRSIFDLPNLPQTQQALEQQANELSGTQMALGTREAGLNAMGTQQVLELQITQAFGALNFAATQAAAANALQAAQDALNSQLTSIGQEATLNAVRTQAAVGQAQLNQTAEQQAQDATASQAQQMFDATETQAASNAVFTATAAAISTVPVATPPANTQP